MLGCVGEWCGGWKWMEMVLPDAIQGAFLLCVQRALDGRLIAVGRLESVESSVGAWAIWPWPEAGTDDVGHDGWRAGGSFG